MKILRIIHELTPPIIWRMSKHLLKEEPQKDVNKQPQSLKGQFYCPVCGKNVVRFNPLPLYYEEKQEKYPSAHPLHLAEMLNTHAYSCPHCYATDRDRLYALFLLKKFEELKNSNITDVTFIDFAPSKSLQRLIKSYSFVQYRSADLYMDDVDDKVDITEMKIYADNQFDIMLCSHVLEHVQDDLKAMSELHRILKVGGWGIIVVPINLGLENDFENEKYTSEEDRWRYFGQYDHVRTYSKKGFISKLESVGFNVHQYGIDFFGMVDFEKCGIHPRSVIYVVSK